MSSSQPFNPSHILPPQIDQQITFGTMWIRINRIKIIGKKSTSQNKVLIQFWGQKQPAIISPHEQKNNTISYQINCPITYFKQYLWDMKKNLKLQVENVGKIDFDITKFLKNNLQITSKEVFDHFKGVFDILGRNNKKIGSVQLQMASNFYPDIAIRQFNKSQSEINKSSSKSIIDRIRTPKHGNNNNGIVSPSVQNTNKIDKDLAIDILAIQRPELLKQFYQETLMKNKNNSDNSNMYVNLDDNRIANSLNTQMSTQKFNPNKYLQQHQQSQIVIKSNQPSQQQLHLRSKSKQLQIELIQHKLVSQDLQDFPKISKVLTYSNLKLTQQQKQPKSINKMQPHNINNLQKQFYQQQQQSEHQFPQKPPKIQQQQQKQNKKLSEQQISKKSINKEMQIQKIQRISKHKIQSPIKQDKQILSRVVNLDEQLKKSQIYSPIKEKQKQIIFNNINNISPITQQNYFKERLFHNQINNNLYKNINEQRSKTYTNKYLNINTNMLPTNQLYNNHNHNQISSIDNRMKKTYSKLLLNLLCQIQLKSISFHLAIQQQPQKFFIIHRPYGCKQRIKLGPAFQPKSSKIIIICPITQQLVNKMDKLPFIIQFWNSITNKFIGIVKIQLKKFKKGFSLDGRLNEIAIKTSMLPLIIQKGQIQIKSLNEDNVGHCRIYTAIGTSAQLESYLNIDSNGGKIEQKQENSGNNIINKNNNKNNINNNNNNNNINNIKNNNNSNNNNNNIPQSSQPLEPEHDKLCFDNIHIQFTQLLSHIDSNSLKNIKTLSSLMIKHQLSSQQFRQFLHQIQFTLIQHNSRKLEQLIRILKRNNKLQAHPLISTYLIKSSFDQYKQIKDKINKQFNKVSKYMINVINKNISHQTKQQIYKQSSFNLIEKNKLVEIMLQNKQYKQQKQEQHKMIKYYLNRFYSQYIDIKLIFQYQHYINYQILQPKLIFKFVYEQFYCKSQQHNLLNNLIEFLKINKISQNNHHSLWFLVSLSYQCKNNQGLFRNKIQELAADMERQIQIKEFLQTQINKQTIKQQFNTKNTKINNDNQVKQHKNININTNKIQINENPSITQSNIHQILMNKQNQQKIIQSQINKINIEPQQQHQHQSNLIENQSQLSQPERYYQHTIILKGIQLYLQQPVKDDNQYQIRYDFPYDQQIQITSKKFRIYQNKHKYSINLYGKHKIIINQNTLKDYMNQVPIKFQVIKNKINTNNNNTMSNFNIKTGSNINASNVQILMEGNLHPDQFLEEIQQSYHNHISNNTNNQIIQSTQTKIITLFNEDINKISGKLKIQLKYQLKQTQKQIIGKQTIYNLYLPKSGYVNFTFNINLQPDKLLQQYKHILTNTNQDQFYILSAFTLFPEHSKLTPHYPPISSKLFSNLSHQLTFSNSIKLHLTQQILQYIKQKNCLVELMLIYYQKQHGGYNKKEINVANLKIPLLNLIQQDGIKGNYAFKNKYGVFVALAHTDINYNKYQYHHQHQQFHQHQQLHQNPLSLSPTYPNLQKYHILIHFKQLINFQQSLSPLSIRFQTIINKKKHQTQKIHLPSIDQPFLLINDHIHIELNEEQFYVNKILPIKANFDNKEKYAIDINMKGIIKHLQNNKYYVNSGYFLVVNQQSQLTKIRIGARIIIIKSNQSPQLQQFISSYSYNLNFNILQQLSQLRDLQDYNKLLELFRTNLKLSKRVFQQSLKQLTTKRSQKLSISLMISQIQYKLNLSPIFIIDNQQQQLNNFIRNLQQTISYHALVEQINYNHQNIKFKNIEESIIKLYSFQNLSAGDKIDKNVQYFELKKQIDLLVLARKIKITKVNHHNDSSQQNNEQQSQRLYKQLKITIQKGTNFHYLYNGIKPNPLIKIAQINYYSKAKSRSSQPIFNQTIREIVQTHNQSMYRNLHFQVYHVPSSNFNKHEQQQQILIGEGSINLLSILDFSSQSVKSQQKKSKVIISSTMSSKMKASLQITLSLSFLGENHVSSIRQQQFRNNQNMQNQHEIQNVNRIQSIIKDINKNMDNKKYMFQQSSDTDSQHYY